MKLPALTGKQVRQKGSHVFLRQPDGRRTVVPVHAGELSVNER
jgi:predicted RNA binding protein YcfA (HicA-like mRNA interferase family)